MLVHDLHRPIDRAFSVEKRLLTIFRAFALVRLVTSMLFLILPRPNLTNLYWSQLLAVFEVTFLLLYLSLPGLTRLFGRYYLPVAIAWATLLPLLVQNITLYWEFERLAFGTMNEPQFALVENALILGSLNQTILVLIVPLIMVAWAYPRSVLTLYCVGLALFDLLMTMLFIRIDVTVFLLAFALIIFRTLLYAVIGIMINQLVNIQLEQQRRLVEANAKLEEYAVIREQLATSNERNRIARELHDTLAHTLSAATVQLEAVNIIWDQQPQKAHQMVTKSAAMMREGLAETRRALHALRAGSLDNENLLNAITVLAESLMTRYTVSIEVQASTPITLHNATVVHSLYRIVQEALFNAVRHAQAEKIRVTLDSSATQLTITVADNGIGFDPATASANGHYGLRGMQERAQQINADFQVISRIGAGTTMMIRVLGNGNDDTNSNL
jgi:signal transduction histidine kinase